MHRFLCIYFLLPTVSLYSIIYIYIYIYIYTHTPSSLYSVISLFPSLSYWRAYIHLLASVYMILHFCFFDKLLFISIHMIFSSYTQSLTLIYLLLSNPYLGSVAFLHLLNIFTHVEISLNYPFLPSF